jgi:hypothetical protein
MIYVIIYRMLLNKWHHCRCMFYVKSNETSLCKHRFLGSSFLNNSFFEKRSIRWVLWLYLNYKALSISFLSIHCDVALLLCVQSLFYAKHDQQIHICRVGWYALHLSDSEVVAHCRYQDELPSCWISDMKTFSSVINALGKAECGNRTRKTKDIWDTRAGRE